MTNRALGRSLGPYYQPLSQHVYPTSVSGSCGELKVTAAKVDKKKTVPLAVLFRRSNGERWHESQPAPPYFAASKQARFLPQYSPPSSARLSRRGPHWESVKGISCSLECRAWAVRHGAGDTLLWWDHRQLLIPLDAHDLRGSSDSELWPVVTQVLPDCSRACNVDDLQTR